MNTGRLVKDLTFITTVTPMALRLKCFHERESEEIRGQFTIGLDFRRRPILYWLLLVPIVRFLNDGSYTNTRY